MSCQEKGIADSPTIGILRELSGEKTKMPSKMKKFLSDNNECYVLITCGRPSKEGKMQVEMTYEGDACLAAYLIESACGIMDDNEELQSSM